MRVYYVAARHRARGWRTIVAGPYMHEHAAAADVDMATTAGLFDAAYHECEFYVTRSDGGDTVRGWLNTLGAI